MLAEINHQDYQVSYDPDTAVITCSGQFRIRGDEYIEIAQLLETVADAKPPAVTLDLRKLQYLNSSGINNLSKFVLKVHKHNASSLLIKGSDAFPWQRKSLKNLQRLLPGLQLEFED